SITDIDSHFRVFAGPGAGKTHWLVNHINHVVRESQKLSPVRKIACITYTNVAADEIIFRLGNLTEFVESSTIHSFLYLNVVKPYCHLLKGTDSDSIVNGRELDGHDDYPPNYGRIRSWLSQIKSKNRKDYVWYLSDNQ